MAARPRCHDMRRLALRCTHRGKYFVASLGCRLGLLSMSRVDFSAAALFAVTASHDIDIFDAMIGRHAGGRAQPAIVI